MFVVALAFCRAADLINNLGLLVPILFLIFTLIFILTLADDQQIFTIKSTTSSYFALGVGGFILVVCTITFYKSISRYHFLLCFSITAFVSSALIIESTIRNFNSLQLLVASGIIVRTLYLGAIYDSIIICISYLTNNFAAVTSYDRIELTVGRLCLLLSIIFGLQCAVILRCALKTIQTGNKFLIEMKSKTQKQAEIASYFAKAHFPNTIVESMLMKPDYYGDEVSMHFEHVAPASAPASTFTRSMKTPSIVDIAERDGILFDIEAAARTAPDVELIELLSKMERRIATVVAIKVVNLGCGGEDEVSSALNSTTISSVHSVLDSSSRRRAITAVKRVGSTWVGCTGFFRPPEEEGVLHGRTQTAETDCHGAILFAAEVAAQFTKRGIGICCAVGNGDVTGGFLYRSTFDLIGPEIK
jgi:hypothetical protein